MSEQAASAPVLWSDTDYRDAMMCAFDEAADGVEQWEFGGSDSDEEASLHKLAGADVAKRIRRMADRYLAKHGRD